VLFGLVFGFFVLAMLVLIVFVLRFSIRTSRRGGPR
jgi:hypothetical protein